MPIVVKKKKGLGESKVILAEEKKESVILVEEKKAVELPKELREAAYMIGGGALAATITANRKRLLGEAGEIPKTEPQAEPFTSENANSGNELMIDEADVKTILDEWLSVAVQCDEKDAAALQDKCADELYSFVVNNLTTNVELEDVFADRAMRQIHMAAASIAKEMFGRNRELCKIIRDTDDIVEQFKEALLICGASIDTNKTILEEWLLKAVQCDEKDAAMLQEQCAEELYAYVVNNLTTDDELAGVFADMTASQIRAATAYIAKELFDMNMELHSTIIRNTDSIVEQFEKALWSYDKSTNNNDFLEKTVFDKLVEAAKKDDTAQSHDKNTIYHFINSILLYIAENVNDENDDYEGVTVRDVVTYDASNEVYKLVDCAKWVVEQVFEGNDELMEVIESCTDAAEQFEAIYEKYELDGYEVDIDMRLIRSSYAQLIAAISNAKSATSLPYVKSTIPLIKSMNAIARKSMNAATLTAMKVQERIL